MPYKGSSECQTSRSWRAAITAMPRVCPLQVESHPGWTSSFYARRLQGPVPGPHLRPEIRATYPQGLLTYIRWQITYMWLDERLML